MANSHRRPPFRDQTLTGILLSMVRALLRGSASRPAGSQAAMRARRAQGLLREGTPRTLDDTPEPMSDGPSGTLVLGGVAVIVVGAVVASIVILVRLFGGANDGVLHIAIPGSATSTPATSATPPPLAPLVVPVGVPLTASRVFGGGAPAALLQPQEAVRGKDGFVYVADTGNKRIAVFDGKGRLLRSTTVGMAGALLAPFSLALTPQGHLLVLDSDAGLITEYDVTGVPVRESARTLSLVHARGIAVDAKGAVFIADPAANAIYTLGSDLTLLHTQPAKSGTGADIFEQPSAVAVASNGTVYVLDSQNNRIEQFTSDWQLQYAYPMVPSDTLHAPHILPLRDGRLLVSDPRDDKLLLFGAAGAQPQAFALSGRSGGLPCVSLGLASDTLPNVLVTCNGSGQIWRVKVPGL